MPYSCSVFGCSNEPNIERGIGLHKVPNDGDTRPEVKRRRRLWVQFINTKRKNYTVNAHTRVCSAHFHSDDFERKFTSLPGAKPTFPRLARDQFGVIGVPRFQHSAAEETTLVSDRSRRNVGGEWY